MIFLQKLLANSYDYNIMILLNWQREIKLKYILGENIRFIRQILKLSKSELIKTYKGAALGPLWALIKPTITIFVYWFAFQLGLRTNTNIQGHSFFIFLMTGMIPWFFMGEAILDGSRSIRSNKHFVTKLPFPVSTIMTYVTLSKLYTNFGILVIGYIVMLFSGIKPSIYNIQILFYMPLMFIFFTCLAWITAPLSCISRDFENVVKSIITAIFWLSGIVWDPYSLKSEVLRRIVLLNPVNYFANGYRNTFLYEKWFFETSYETIGFLIILIIVMFVGATTYNRLRKRILDVI